MKNHNYESRELLGHFKNTFIAQSSDESIKKSGSSGGVVTSLLLYALENRIIDGAVCVGYKEALPWMYEVKIVNSINDIIKSAGSKYVKINTKDFLDVLEREGKSYKKLAVVGVNCNLAPLIRLKKRYKNLYLFIGLFCGWCMGFDATEYLLGKIGVKDKSRIKRIDYRGGDYPGGFTVEFKNGKIKGIGKHYYDFVNLMFVPKACLDCKFYMAEDADISVGDAWIKGKKDYSTVITRTDKGEDVFKKAVKKGYIIKEEIDYKQVIRYHFANIKHKKIGDSLFMKLLIKSLNNKIVIKIIPFKLFGRLAKLRRKINHNYF